MKVICLGINKKKNLEKDLNKTKKQGLLKGSRILIACN